MRSDRAGFGAWLIGEEGRDPGPDRTPIVWVVDPLDGTTNYAHGYPCFCVSIGLEHKGELVVGVVYDPILDEMFAAERGGGATLNGRRIHVSEVVVLVLHVGDNIWQL